MTAKTVAARRNADGTVDLTFITNKGDVSVNLQGKQIIVRTIQRLLELL